MSSLIDPPHFCTRPTQLRACFHRLIRQNSAERSVNVPERKTVGEKICSLQGLSPYLQRCAGLLQHVYVQSSLLERLCVVRLRQGDGNYFLYSHAKIRLRTFSNPSIPVGEYPKQIGWKVSFTGKFQERQTAFLWRCLLPVCPDNCLTNWKTFMDLRLHNYTVRGYRDAGMFSY